MGNMIIEKFIPTIQGLPSWGSMVQKYMAEFQWHVSQKQQYEILRNGCVNGPKSTSENQTIINIFYSLPRVS